MTRPKSDPPRLPTPDELGFWLESTGWRRLGATQFSALYVYDSDSGRRNQLLVPLRTELNDYEDGVRDALAKAAVITGRPIPAVVREASSRTGRDVVRVRSETEEPGVISLADGASLWASSRALILASAAAAVAPRPAFGTTLRPDAADAYISEVEASVVPGSFIVVLSCPTEPDIRANVLGRDGLPYGRLVTEGLVRAVQSTVEIASDSQRRSESGAWLELVPSGVSADLLDALMQIRNSRF